MWEESATVDVSRLFKLRRSVANFVSIINKSNYAIHVNYSSGKETLSMLDPSRKNHANVVLSAQWVRKGMVDPTVGQALHETQHINHADVFNIITTLKEQCDKKQFNSLGPIWALIENGKLTIGPGEEIKLFIFIKTFLNIFEDRRIEAEIYRTAPGYQGYIDALHEVYWQNKDIGRALRSVQFLQENLKSYIFHLTNLTHRSFSWQALTLLPNLESVCNLTRLSNLANPHEAFKTTLEVVAQLVEYLGWDHIGPQISDFGFRLNNTVENQDQSQDQDQADNQDQSQTIPFLIADKNGNVFVTEVFSKDTQKSFCLNIGQDEVTAIAFSPSRNYIYTGHKSGVIKIWDLGSVDQGICQKSLDQYTNLEGGPILDLEISADETIMSGIVDKKLRSEWGIWDLELDHFELVKSIGQADINNISFTKDFVLSMDRNKIFGHNLYSKEYQDIVNGQCFCSCNYGLANNMIMALNPPTASLNPPTSSTSFVSIYDLSTNQQVISYHLSICHSTVRCIETLADGKVVLVTDKKIFILEIDDTANSATVVKEIDSPNDDAKEVFTVEQLDPDDKSKLIHPVIVRFQNKLILWIWDKDEPLVSIDLPKHAVDVKKPWGADNSGAMILINIGDKGDENENEGKSKGKGKSEKGKISKSLCDRIEKALKQEIERINHQLDKGSISEEEQNQLDNYEQGDFKQVDITSDSANIPLKTKVNKLNVLRIDDSEFPYNIDQLRNEAKTLGRNLRNALRFREDKTVEFSRRKNGKIDPRILHEFRAGNPKIFRRRLVEEYPDVTFIVSIDASSSMGHRGKSGSRIRNSVLVAAAVANATQDLSRVTVVVSERHSGENDIWVKTYYDSRNPNSKIDNLFAIKAQGLTPEGIAFNGMMEDLPIPKSKEQVIFVNLADGEPYIPSLDYFGKAALEHTALQYRKMHSKGIKTVTFGVDIEDESEKKAFDMAYGKNSWASIKSEDIIRVISEYVNRILLTR